MTDWNQEQKNLFRNEVFNIISSIKSLRVIACVSEAPTAYEVRGVETRNDLYFHTYKPITERFQYYLQGLTNLTGQSLWA